MNYKTNLFILLIIGLSSCSHSSSNQKAESNVTIKTNTIVNVVQPELKKPMQKSDIVSSYNPDVEKKAFDSILNKVKQQIKKHKEIPPDGNYIYDIAYAEWQGQSMGEKVLVIIKGNAIKIISEGNPSMTAKKGDLLDQGVLIKHNVTGDWLISSDPSDANLEAYGDCVGSPMVIDFKAKKYWTC